jgi:hypothetical protein
MARPVPSTKRDALSWIVLMLSIVYVLWTCVLLMRRLPAFTSLFSVMGAELPAGTRLAIAVSRPGLLWSFAAVEVAALLFTHMRVADARVRVAVAFLVCLTNGFLASLITEALILPMLHGMRQVG